MPKSSRLNQILYYVHGSATLEFEQGTKLHDIGASARKTPWLRMTYWLKAGIL